MRKRAWVAAGLASAAAVALVAVVLGRLGPKEDGKPPEPPLAFSASEVVRPQRLPLPLRLEFSGALVAPHSAVVRAKAAGTLLTLAVAEGHRVRAGQVLGRIDPAEFDSRSAERAAAVDAARAQFLQAERTHQTNQRLADQQFISANALDNSRSALDAARANLEAAQAQWQTTQLVRRDGTLLAPIDGLVARRQALPGEKLALEQPVLTLVDLRTLELAGVVGTHEVGWLSPGMAVSVQVEGQPAPMTGRLDRIAPAAEAGTRAIGVAVVVDNPGERLRAGQYAVATVTLPDPAPRQVLPLSAIAGTPGEAAVWVIERGALVRRAVTLGRRDERGGRVEVLGGLADDALVLALRFDGLREGRAASVSAAPPASAAAASPVLR